MNLKMQTPIRSEIIYFRGTFSSPFFLSAHSTAIIQFFLKKIKVGITTLKLTTAIGRKSESVSEGSCL